VLSQQSFGQCRAVQSADEKMVSQTFASWNQIAGWLRRLEGLRNAA
jgi:hypothetical protein